MRSCVILNSHLRWKTGAQACWLGLVVLHTLAVWLSRSAMVYRSKWDRSENKNHNGRQRRNGATTNDHLTSWLKMFSKQMYLRIRYRIRQDKHLYKDFIPAGPLLLRESSVTLLGLLCSIFFRAASSWAAEVSTPIHWRKSGCCGAGPTQGCQPDWCRGWDSVRGLSWIRCGNLWICKVREVSTVEFTKVQSYGLRKPCSSDKSHWTQLRPGGGTDHSVTSTGDHGDGDGRGTSGILWKGCIDTFEKNVRILRFAMSSRSSQVKLCQACFFLEKCTYQLQEVVEQSAAPFEMEKTVDPRPAIGFKCLENDWFYNVFPVSQLCSDSCSDCLWLSYTSDWGIFTVWKTKNGTSLLFIAMSIPTGAKLVSSLSWRCHNLLRFWFDSLTAWE